MQISNLTEKANPYPVDRISTENTETEHAATAASASPGRDWPERSRRGV